jgi:hypothetical protein
MCVIVLLLCVRSCVLSTGERSIRGVVVSRLPGVGRLVSGAVTGFGSHRERVIVFRRFLSRYSASTR